MSRLKAVGCATPIAIAFYIVVGLLLLGQYGGKVLNYVDSTGWETTQGEIIENRVIDARDNSGERWLPTVTYRYEVNGETFENDQIDLRGTIYIATEEAATERIAAYPVGQQVTLYVDPNDPARSVLDRYVQPGTWWLVGGGLALLLLGVGLGVASWLTREPASTDQ